MIQKYPQLLKPPSSDLFEILWIRLLQSRIKDKKSNIQQTLINQNLSIQQQKQFNQLKIKQRIISLLNQQIKLSVKYQLISIDKIIIIIDLLDKNIDYKTIILSQRILINLLSLNNDKFNIDNDLLKCIINTKSSILLPFRIIVNKIDQKNKQIMLPSIKQLYKYCLGSQWLNWLEVYLTNNKQLQSFQANEIVKIIQQSNPQQILQSINNKKKVIYKFIIALKDQNLLYLFYTALRHCIYNQQSILRIEQLFFKQRNQFIYQFKSIFRIISKFNPNSYYISIEDQQFLQVKLLYILKIIQVNPQNSQNLQLNFFKCNQQNYLPFHQICHFVIDIINLSQHQNTNSSSYIISQALLTLLALLKCKQTNNIILLVMSINQPKFTFLSSEKLNIQFLKILNNFLQYILQSKDIEYLLLLDIKNTIDCDIRYVFQFRYQNNNQYKKYIQIYYNKYNDTSSNNNNVLIFPINWLCHLLKIIHLQSYNPKIISLILEKLLIIPLNSTVKNIPKQTPILLTVIIENLNLCAFWQSLLKYFEVTFKFSKKLELYNKILLMNSPQFVQIIFYSLKILRTLLVLYDKSRNIKQIVQCNKYQRTLLMLEYLNYIEMQFINPYESIFEAVDKLNPILTLIAIMNHPSQLINDTINLKYIIGWTSTLQGNENKFTKIINQYGSTINYKLLYNCMVYPLNKYLQCYQSIQTLALECLNIIANNPPYISMQKLLSQGISKLIPINIINNKKQNKFKIKSMDQIIIDIFLEQICNPKNNNLQLRQKIWQLLSNSINNINQQFALKVTNKYIIKVKLYQKNNRINYLISNVLIHLFHKITNNSQTILFQEYLYCFIQNIQSNMKIKQVLRCLQKFQNFQFSSSSCNIFEKILQQKILMQFVDSLKCISNLIKICLNNLYKGNPQIYKSINILNSILVQSNLFLISSILPTQKLKQKYSLSYEYNHCQEIENYSLSLINIPRIFKYDPRIHYILQQQFGIVQFQQMETNNILAYIVNSAIDISHEISQFISILLTIGQTYYGNQPIYISTKDFPQLFCHNHLPHLPNKGTGLFGSPELEAANRIKNIGQICLQKLEKGIQEEKEAMIIIGFCLEWLRAHKKADNQLNLFMRRINKKNFWLQKRLLFHPVTIKVAMSLISIHYCSTNKILSEQTLNILEQTIYNTLLIENSQPTINSYIKQCAFTMISLLPTNDYLNCNNSNILQKILEIWCNETNFQFFYNQSRVILQLCDKKSQQISYLEIINKCNMINNLPINMPYYEGNLRNKNRIVWIWALQIRSTLMNQQKLILVSNQITNFIMKNKNRIISTLTQKSNIITMAYLEELQSTLKLILVCMLNSAWVEVNRKLFEQLTYLLTHKTISILVDIICQKVKFQPISENQKKCHEIKYKTIITDEINSSNISHKSAFSITMQLKVITTLKIWSFATLKGMQDSWYVQEYFDKPVYQSYKYGLTYWDHMNKIMIDLEKYCLKCINKFSKIEKCNELLQLVSNCSMAPQTFIEHGYLPAIFQLPKNLKDLISEINILALMVAEVATVHLLQEIRFKKKYNNLLRNHIELYSRRLIQNLKNLQQQCKDSKKQGFSRIQKMTLNLISQ